MVALRDPRNGGVSDAGNTVGTTDSPVASSTARLQTPSPSPTTTKSGATTAPPVNLGSSSDTSSTSGSAATDAAHSVPLVVLNNTTTSGLARQAAKRFESGGWTVTSSGNLTNNILSTCAYYDPDVNGAQAAAEALMAQYPTIKRTAPKFDGLPAGPVVVVLTPDYQAG